MRFSELKEELEKRNYQLQIVDNMIYVIKDTNPLERYLSTKKLSDITKEDLEKRIIVARIDKEMKNSIAMLRPELVTDSTASLLFDFSQTDLAERNLVAAYVIEIQRGNLCLLKRFDDKNERMTLDLIGIHEDSETKTTSKYFTLHEIEEDYPHLMSLAIRTSKLMSEEEII